MARDSCRELLKCLSLSSLETVIMLSMFEILFFSCHRLSRMFQALTSGPPLIYLSDPPLNYQHHSFLQTP